MLPHGSGRSAGRATARVAEQQPLATQRPEWPKAATWPCGRRLRGEAAERRRRSHRRRRRPLQQASSSEAVALGGGSGGGGSRISGHSRFSSFSLVFHHFSCSRPLKVTSCSLFSPATCVTHSALPLCAQMLFVFVQCISALFVCST